MKLWNSVEGQKAEEGLQWCKQEVWDLAVSSWFGLVWLQICFIYFFKALVEAAKATNHVSSFQELGDGAKR